MDYYYPDNVLKIPHPIPGSKVAQYMFVKGVKNFNLCGQLCVAYVTQDETGINDVDVFLDYWKSKDLKWYQQIFKNGLGRTTSLYDLDRMLAAYDYPPSLRWNKDNQSPIGVSIALEKYQAIVGVGIDNKGYLISGGIRHWVVLDRVDAIDDQYAIVDVYNPFTNSIRPFTWRELMMSMGTWKQGLWVSRK